MIARSDKTQSSVADLLLFELDQAPGVPLKDIQEVSNYHRTTCCYSSTDVLLM